MIDPPVLQGKFIIDVTINCGGCSDEKEDSGVSRVTIEQVLKENTSKWLAIPGVEGTAIGMCNDKPCIKIFTSARPDEIQPMIPAMIEGYQVVVEYTGQFRALEE